MLVHIDRRRALPLAASNYKRDISTEARIPPPLPIAIPSEKVNHPDPAEAKKFVPDETIPLAVAICRREVAVPVKFPAPSEPQPTLTQIEGVAVVPEQPYSILTYNW